MDARAIIPALPRQPEKGGSRVASFLRPENESSCSWRRWSGLHAHGGGVGLSCRVLLALEVFDPPTALSKPPSSGSAPSHAPGPWEDPGGGRRAQGAGRVRCKTMALTGKSVGTFPVWDTNSSSGGLGWPQRLTAGDDSVHVTHLLSPGLMFRC